MGQQIFSDNTTANTEIRNNNIKTLEAAGFVHGGINSRSGSLELVEKKASFQLVFGVRCNIAGKRNKYFSLSKDFQTKEDALAFVKTSGLKSK